MKNAQSLTSTELLSIRALLDEVPLLSPLTKLTDSELDGAINALSDTADSRWQEAPSEIISPRREGVLGMVLVRKRRQLAYSLKLSNLTRDPFASMPAITMTALPVLVATWPSTFPSFLLAIALAWLRAYAQPIGYGEAALLHHMNQISVVKGKVSEQDLADAGRVLVDSYGYVKGQNSNEISALLASLLAWKAIEHFDGGFRAIESVPFGLGPMEYVS
jgi:hypothetical protein